MMRFDTAKVFKKLKLMQSGTGRMGDAVGVPANAVQKMLAIGEAPDDIGKKLCAYLGTDVLLSAEVEDAEQATENTPLVTEEALARIDLGEDSIKVVKEKIDEGLYKPVDVYEAEIASEAPRVTLLTYLREYHGLGGR